MQTAGFVVDVWEEAAPGAARSSQDSSLVLPFEDGLRVAAIDGATPHPDQELKVGCDAAVYASALVRLALHSRVPLLVALENANETLHVRAANVWMIPRATVAAADIGEYDTGVVRAGDCVAFARHGEAWRPLFPELTSPAQMRARIAEIGEVSLEALMRMVKENPQGADPTPLEDRPTVAVGTFPELRPQRAEVPAGWDELVLASDGARLDAHRVADLERWLADLREWERAGGDGTVEPWKPHDDVTVVRVRPTR